MRVINLTKKIQKFSPLQKILFKEIFSKVFFFLFSFIIKFFFRHCCFVKLTLKLCHFDICRSTDFIPKVSRISYTNITRILCINI